MKSKTSFFNGMLLKKNAVRFSPIWIVYLACWTIGQPLLLAMVLSNNSIDQSDASYAIGVMTTMVGPVVACVYGLIVAMAVFSYLYTARSVSMMHSLPIRRSGLFLTNYVSGLLFMVVPNLIVAVLTALVTLTGGVFALDMILTWFLGMSAMELFFFSFAALLAMFTGHLLALPVFYAIFNCLCYVLYWTITNFITPYLYGMSAGFDTSGWVVWMTPLYCLYRNLETAYTYRTETLPDGGMRSSLDGVAIQGTGTLAAYAVVGVIFAVLAYLVYRRRRSETAGDIVSVGWAKVVFRYGVAITAAFTIGQGVYYLLFDSSTLAGAVMELICMILAAAIGFLVAQMLLHKSFRVLKRSGRGVIVCAVVILAVFAGAYFDVTGYTRYVPDADQVQQVTVKISAYDYSKATLRDADNIEKVLAVHQYAVEHRRELDTEGPGYYVNEEGAGLSASIYVQYTMNNGSVKERRYRVLLQENDLEDVGSITGLVASLTDSAEYRAYHALEGLADASVTTKIEDGAKIEDATFSYQTQNGAWQYRVLSEAEQAAVCQALLEDAAAGRMPKVYLTGYPDDYGQTHYINELAFTYSKLYEDGSLDECSVSLCLTAEMTSTIAELEELGILSDGVKLTTEAEAYDDDMYVDPIPYEDADEPIHLPAEEEGNATVEV